MSEPEDVYRYEISHAITLSTGSSNRYSYLYDPRNNVSLLVDQAGGVEESYGYSAYGSPNASLTKKASGFSTGAVPTNPVRFQGKRFDSGSASYDMGARRYSASTGRWLSQDMYYGALDDLGLSQDPLTANRYAFLGANPINYVELDGHYWGEHWWHKAKHQFRKHAVTIGLTVGFGPFGTDLGLAYEHRSSIERQTEKWAKLAAHQIKKRATLSNLSTVLSVASAVAYASCAFDEAVGCGLGLALSAAATSVSGVDMERKCSRHSKSCSRAITSFGVSLLSTLGPDQLPAIRAMKWRLNALANLGSTETQISLDQKSGEKNHNRGKRRNR